MLGDAYGHVVVARSMRPLMHPSPDVGDIHGNHQGRSCYHIGILCKFDNTISHLVLPPPYIRSRQLPPSSLMPCTSPDIRYHPLAHITRHILSPLKAHAPHPMRPLFPVICPPSTINAPNSHTCRFVSAERVHRHVPLGLGRIFLHRL